MSSTSFLAIGARMSLVAGLASIAFFMADTAHSQDQVRRTLYMINFHPGSLKMKNEKDIMMAAMWYVEKGYSLEVEGRACDDDGEGNGSPDFRVELAGKRADIVLEKLSKFGVPKNMISSISYADGGCNVLITVY